MPQLHARVDRRGGSPALIGAAAPADSAAVGRHALQVELAEANNGLMSPPGRSVSDAVAIPGPPPSVRPSPARWTAVAALGPAFVASVAYVDPGNFATNIAGGAKYGYMLVWVVVLANAIAMLVQFLAAKLGVVSGTDLARATAERVSRPVRIGLWLQAELVAMCTDVAEFVGAALALHLLFGMPLVAAGVLTGIVAFAILGLQSRGHRPFELAIGGLLALVLGGFLYEVLRVGPSVRDTAGGLVPSLAGDGALYVAVGILGATVMPHAVYVHSALARDRHHSPDGAGRRRLLRLQRLDIAVALGIAGLVNVAMLIMAARLFHDRGITGVESIEDAHAGLGTLVGGGAALVFAVALLASGFSSSSVGTYAGQVVMSGFTRRRIPLALRRALTMAPALLVLGLGIDPSAALVLSQVVLSFGIPFALVPLVILTSRRDVMGDHVNRRITTVVASLLAVLVIVLNVALLVQLAL